MSTVFEGISKSFHQYLEAQYHIWDEGLIAERKALLDTAGVTFQDPRLEATPFYGSAKPYAELEIPLAAQKILTLASTRPLTGIYARPYQHQAESLQCFLKDGGEVIVATGTGSGKTESFLMPILGSLAIESTARPEVWVKPGVRALLLYPMNALVNDQLSRLRRLLGDEEIAKSLRGGRAGNATFGMYTSRTPYAGSSSPGKDKDRIDPLLAHLFSNLNEGAEQRLKSEGKWPAKDILNFAANNYRTQEFDSELLTRQEMRARAPDLLITNYSMLEYMLLRPIERPIFQQTAAWLAADERNKFTIVLDEAHMYRGSNGAEVAYLLRRLHSRLGVPRSRIRYILTSASLGSSNEAIKKVKEFARDLTGLADTSKSFTVISGKPLVKVGARPATQSEANALSQYQFSSLHELHIDSEKATIELKKLFDDLKFPVNDDEMTVELLRHAVYQWLAQFGPASLASNILSNSPKTMEMVCAEVFPSGRNAHQSMESLISLMSFGRDDVSGKVYSPVRAHLFFRGLPGLYACVNPDCSVRAQGNSKPSLGKMYAEPRLRCDCGGRVYELLTHRDCGAAFLRGYVSSETKDFLWHEPSKGLWSDRHLMEVHLGVEITRHDSHTATVGASKNWLHIGTGRIIKIPPSGSDAKGYLEVIRPDFPIQDKGRWVLSFDRECPVCLKKWQGQSKIMDLATKGEAPFAHLVKEQVALQPPTQPACAQSPNEGRKSLLFSDGRQKAARLARDIPREIEQDVFRQLLLMAAERLTKEKIEPLLNKSIYIAFIDVLASVSLQLFDGKDRHIVQTAVAEYIEWHEGDLRGALQDIDLTAPPRFSAQLLRQLGSRFYSVASLTLAYMRPSDKALANLAKTLDRLKPDEIVALSVVWLQGLSNEFAFDPAIRSGIRLEAAGYPVGIPTAKGFSKRQEVFLAERGISVQPIRDAFSNFLAAKDENGNFYIHPGRVRLEVAVKKNWFQCLSCTATSPVSWWNACPNCQAKNITSVNPEDSAYLRARKGFWRDPVVRILEGKAKPMNLNVEEHTAQLSHRDADGPSTTTEDFERRFKDILVRNGDISIDVLSSTTTMEVGIDIGSLVAVGLRNIPPLRQNYQQRAGRAGRRGASMSTVVTYAQNSPHDNHYFKNPEIIISGDPAMPGVDTKNRKIVERHVRAQLIHAFFIGREGSSVTGNIFSMLGDTWAFFTGEGDFSLRSLVEWIEKSTDAEKAYAEVSQWLPVELGIDPRTVAKEFWEVLHADRPLTEDEIDQADEYLIEYLFSHGHLPAYAFPRDLCALQIERDGNVTGRPQVPILQRPQQGLNIALTEYAPGRLVVVNKKTYRIGTVAASSGSADVNRATRLFAGKRSYVHCDSCLFTAGFTHSNSNATKCPLCANGKLLSVSVIQPEVVFPEGGREIDEFDDEQVYSQATSAQLPLPEGAAPFAWELVLTNAKLATARDQSMVMVNKGADVNDEEGFWVCQKCGKTSLTGKPLGPHKRDYRVLPKKGEPKPSVQCDGEGERVFLGYSFSSDILLFRIDISKNVRFDPVDSRLKLPISDALQSFSEALVLGISHTLDIDIREVSSGYRFVRLGDSQYAADIFIFDTLSGGAGYATLAGKIFPKVLDAAKSVLEKCTCSSSCDKCLRHYGNRLHHPALDRFLALELLEYLSVGALPKQLSNSEQRVLLKPLRDLLELAGWVNNEKTSTPLQMSKNGEIKEIFLGPSLVSPNLYGWPNGTQKGRLLFTPYEIAKDLPGAYAEVE
ncbi:DEAD/DEAH box helicase [Polaromonas sp. YR568]|uniref:DEAD/DEAH box helicase n=1 Tax=Polaromonas sp. YR568 TaxID=1855301 RepID=UPI00398BF9F6